jgi:hypothetical protein
LSARTASFSSKNASKITEVVSVHVHTVTRRENAKSAIFTMLDMLIAHHDRQDNRTISIRSGKREHAVRASAADDPRKLVQLWLVSAQTVLAATGR